jgi:hypothetical protein
MEFACRIPILPFAMQRNQASPAYRPTPPIALALSPREQIRAPSGFPAMRIAEENCNMVLLATVTLLTASVALVMSAFEPAPSTVSDARAAVVADQTPVRVVGPRFTPNTNPREPR